MSSYEFRMWGIRKRDRQKPYQVRWLVAGRSHAETFVTRALAESFRAELMSAARTGEAFDEVTGLPESRALLRSHLETFGTGEAGRIFHNERGGPFNEASARRAWAKARVSALSEEQVQSPLARRPYDLRHAAASLWLNNGVPATEVARRLGHDVAVLLKIYANCIDGQEDTINDQITAALAAGQDHETLPAAPAVDPTAQPNPRTRCGPEPGR